LLLNTDQHGERTQGGLFSLDGVHPTTIGYGIIAEAFLREMQAQGVPGADPATLPWQDVIANDSLLHAPPALWNDVLGAAEQHAWLWNSIFRTLA
jgi:hypothetical protein